MAWIRFWCRLRDSPTVNKFPYKVDDELVLNILDESKSPLDKIHGRTPIIVDWYGEIGRFPLELRYVRDDEPYTFWELSDLQQLIERYRDELKYCKYIYRFPNPG